jgi:serine/threonine protein kinase
MVDGLERLMNAEHESFKEILAEAAAKASPAERAAYLDGACRGDPGLRARVEALLRVHDQAGGFLEAPVVTFQQETIALSPPVTEKAGDRIGRYKLLQQIGEGGCGVVYIAEQEGPVHRRVALKVIKLGMDTKQVIARFEAERQALALMHNPNIAQVYDAGSTETGRPYFVMELVRGIKITDYCDQNNLTTRERLDLFVQVCHAIQHAHQKGIIHRDIKPSNILVTVNDGVAMPKVIDFGIAKATSQQRLTDKTIFTAFEQFIGTPAYMSPEQAGMTSLDTDTRSDIYALGVLLYELLTGKTPFDAKELLAAGLDGMRRTIREQEPVRPSTRITRERLAASAITPAKSEIRNRKLIGIWTGS